jgi:hypothetical protein
MSGETGSLWVAVQVLLGLFGSLATPNHARPHEIGCFPRPSRCGYPDASNTGVPAGTALRPSGSVTVTDDGATLDGLRITGSVTVAADDVTIENSLIVQPSGGSGSYAVALDQGAGGFTIRDSEVLGPSSRTHGLQSAVWNHHDNAGATATRVYFHRCADCWEGAGTFRDDYMVVDAAYPGSHDEDIYVCGATVKVDHSTLVNRHSQTATVFGDAGCGGNRFVVTDSLLAGGGFVLYPQANSSARTGTTRVVGNRFARCSTSAVYEKASGGTSCARGPDASGLFPHGGYYGLAAYYYRGRGQAWRRNVWDDNLRPACPAGHC